MAYTAGHRREVWMRLVVPRESQAGERRVAATPDTVARLRTLGFEVVVEAGAGQAAGYDDADYVEAGATLGGDGLWAEADVLAKVNPPTPDEVERLREGAVLVSVLQPAQNEALVEQLARRGVSAIALDRIPRISRAQKMDVLSSMANIAGYRAVIEASHRLPRFFGGQITAAGKTPPARVLVIGAGVAGLAALGAARGLGAEVYAFDTRAAAREQVESLGGRFLEVALEESGEGQGGYAKVMSQAFIDAEMALFRSWAPRVDIVITTALIPGRPAPKLWLADMVEAMPNGGVVVDLAAAQGGNCELTEPGEVVERHGVTLIGYTDLVSRLPGHASQFFARNIVHLLDDMSKGDAGFRVDLDDEVVRAALATHAGEVVPPPPPPEPSPRVEPAQRATVEPPVQRQARHASGHGHVAPTEPMSTATLAATGTGAAALFGAIGLFAPAEFVQHFTVFVLACFIGWQVVWNVTPALHTPLMSVTNAISGIIVVGGMIQAGTGQADAAAGLGAVAILVAAINVAGGFAVTQRMLAMFRK